MSQPLEESARKLTTGKERESEKRRLGEITKAREGVITARTMAKEEEESASRVNNLLRRRRGTRASFSRHYVGFEAEAVCGASTRLL